LIEKFSLITIIERQQMNIKLKLKTITLIGSILLAVAPQFAAAQSKTTKLIVAFPPGGPVDFVARSISEALSKELGQLVIVENKAGANGAIAADYVIKSAPDGNTLWLTSVGAVAINPSLYPKLSYKPQKDLAPVSLVVNNVELLVVNPKNPANNPAEFVANAKKQRTTMASSGTGSVPHLAMEQVADATGANLAHVPYKGAAPAITDVMAGHVDGFFGDIPGLINNVKAGKLKPVGLAATQRHPLLPDVKTFDEMGIKGVDSDNWYAIFTANGTPPADIDRINKAIARVLSNDAVKTRLANSGAQPAASTPQQLAELLAKDTAKWERVIRTKNIQP
jgi:tripartite-type tricarboxylate transporter receptor subunit TctC